MTTQARNLSVTVPFSEAMNRVRTVLFQPFDLGKWFIIGFCAWLAYLGEGGGFHGSGGGNFNAQGGRSPRAELERAWDYVVNNLSWLLPLALGLFVAGLVIWLVILWVSSRGRFMFLHCVARNVAEIRVPWHGYAAEANSLFLFRLAVGLISMVVFLPLVSGFAVVVLRMVVRETATFGGVMASIGIGVAMIVAGIAFWMINRLTTDFVVPIQYLRHRRCLEAWGELRRLSPGNFGNLLLYFLFRIVLAVGIGLAVLAVVIATCCIAGCLMALPYIGTVVLLPVLVLERSYSLKYLAQVGPEYDVFTPEAAAV